MKTDLTGFDIVKIDAEEARKNSDRLLAYINVLTISLEELQLAFGKLVTTAAESVDYLKKMDEIANSVAPKKLKVFSTLGDLLLFLEEIEDDVTE